MNKLKILTFVGFYLPGYKSGGPVRTISNMVDHLGDDYEFRIITSDRDATDPESYSGIEVDRWNVVGKARVLYLSPKNRTISAIANLMQKTDHDILYLNSLFNPAYTLVPLLLRRLGRAPIRPSIIAPRGEFSKGALALKKWKKFPFFRIAYLTDLYSNLTWQASSEYEARDIRLHMGRKAKSILIVPNLPPPALVRGFPRSRQPNEPLRILFLSRITPMKNLDFALNVLGKVKVPVIFDIYGPVRDERYWNLCQKLIEKLPSHVIAKFHGPLLPSQVPGIMAAHDLFFLPTLGENYGHVIPEALSAGTPVLIANTTPWRSLEAAGVGWDLNLERPDKFVSCIEHISQISTKEYAALRSRVIKFAVEKLSDPVLVETNRRLFENTITEVSHTS